MTAPFSVEQRKPLPSGLLDDLKAVVGERLAVGEAIRLPHGSSETHFGPIPADAVIFFHSTEEVAAIVKLCVALGGDQLEPLPSRPLS